jgi:hypothetical protein
MKNTYETGAHHVPETGMGLVNRLVKQVLLGLLGNNNKGPKRQGTLLTKAIEKYLENIA